MRLSDAQIAAYAKGAGFTGSNIAIAVAVAIAESGGRTDALSPPNRDGTIDHGLWQINSVHAALLASGSWSNPSDNARMAYSVWKGSGWHAWTTYNTGAYLAYYARGKVAAGQAGTTKTIAATVVPGGPTTTHGKKFKHPMPYKVTPFPGDDYRLTITIAGRGYVVQPEGSGAKIPTFAITIMANWYMGEYPSTDTNYSFCNNWVHGDRDPGLDVLIVGAYCSAYADSLTVTKIPNPGGSIGGGIADALMVLGDLIKFLTNPRNWVRLAMFLIGGALLLMAAAKMAGLNASSVGTIAKAAG